MIDIVTDLRPLLGAVRDQGARPTCLAFAASDAHAALRDGWSPLSCEFAFFHAHRRSGTTPEQGASLSSMLDALRLDGQPAESGWPYLDIVPADLAHWVPPTDVGPRFGRNGAANSCIIPSILAALDSGTPVLLLTMLSKSFYAPSNAGIVDPGRAGRRGARGRPLGPALRQAPAAAASRRRAPAGRSQEPPPLRVGAVLTAGKPEGKVCAPDGGGVKSRLVILPEKETNP